MFYVLCTFWLSLEVKIVFLLCRGWKCGGTMGLTTGDSIVICPQECMSPFQPAICSEWQALELTLGLGLTVMKKRFLQIFSALVPQPRFGLCPILLFLGSSWGI